MGSREKSVRGERRRCFTLIELLVVSSCYFMRIHAKSRLEQHMRLANKSAFFGGDAP